jgi:DNA-binding NarL/FixJ family response regulator
MASVLIIDDYVGTLESYATILGRAGFEAATAATGREGIQLAKGRPFDVILVDLQLPDMSGIDVVREIKLSAVSGRVVIVTVFPGVESSFDAAASGADGYVDGMLFGDEVVNVVTHALIGPLPVRHPRDLHAGDLSEPSHLNAAPPSGIDPRVREVMALIVADLSASQPVAELAARVEWSESTLSHRFSADVAMSIPDYRAEQRLQEIARRLATTHRAVRVIAYSVGYASLSLADFRKAFRRRFGMSAKAYRARFWRGPALPR